MFSLNPNVLKTIEMQQQLVFQGQLEESPWSAGSVGSAVLAESIESVESVESAESMLQRENEPARGCLDCESAFREGPARCCPLSESRFQLVMNSAASGQITISVGGDQRS